MRSLSEESGLEVGFIKTLITIQLFTLLHKEESIHFPKGCDSEKVMSYYFAEKKIGRRYKCVLHIMLKFQNLKFKVAIICSRKATVLSLTNYMG